MPQNPSRATPQTKALIATVIGVLLLGGFAAAGFWYGVQRGESTSEAADATTNQTTNTTTAPNTRLIVGTVERISTGEIEVKQTIDGEIQTILAKISTDTKIQKWDYRKPINKDKGVLIKLADIRMGSQVIVATTDTENSQIDAEVVKMVIYP